MNNKSIIHYYCGKCPIRKQCNPVFWTTFELKKKKKTKIKRRLK